MQEYLCETNFLNYSHPSISQFIGDITSINSKKQLALYLYYKVRDGFLYDPYHLDLRYEALKSSNIIKKQRAWCVEKSIVLASCARKVGIPSRLGYAIVINHIGVEKLASYLKRNEIVFHGYVELFIINKWVKCTPSFDTKICRITGVSPLDWDGETDSLFQLYTGENQFMEYIHDYGLFSDVPIQKMNDEMKKYYPHLFESTFNERVFSFHHL